jgi:hypothetical protein
LERTPGGDNNNKQPHALSSPADVSLTVFCVSSLFPPGMLEIIIIIKKEEEAERMNGKLSQHPGNKINLPVLFASTN